MKKVISVIVLLLLIILSGCSSNNSTDTKDTNNNSTKNETTENDTVNNSADTDIIEHRVEDYLSSVLYISEELEDKSLMIYGLDNENNGQYGILQLNGAYAPLDYGYLTYAPLADGNMIVSNDETAAKRLKYWEFGYTEFGNASIIDSNGKVLFQPEENVYHRMIVINHHAIFVVSATSGFDGIDVKWGVVDNNGEWLHKLDSTGVIVDYIKEHDLIKMSSDGSWDFDGISFTQENDYDNKENNYLRFNLDAPYLYSVSNDTFTKVSYEKDVTLDTRVNDNEWIRERTSVAMAGYAKITTFDLISIENDTVKVSGSIDNYITTINKNKYWHKSNILYSDKNTDGILYPDNITEKVYDYIGVKDGNVFILLKGEDGLPYFAVGDLEGNIIKEPFSPENFVLDTSFTCNDHLVYFKRATNTVYIVNWETEEVVCSFVPQTDMENGADYIYKISDNFIAVVFKDNSKLVNIEIYDNNGNRIA